MKKAFMVTVVMISLFSLDYLGHYKPANGKFVSEKTLEMSYAEYTYGVKDETSKKMTYVEQKYGVKNTKGDENK